MRRWLALLAAATLAVPASAQSPTALAPPPFAAPASFDGQFVLYVANGSGRSTALSDGLGTALKHAGVAFALKPVNWCRQPSAFRDHADHRNQLAAASAMTAEIQAIRQTSPHARVVLAGHSSGCRVVLAAAEMLPPGSVERVLLFAPSVSSWYDVRRALSATKSGIDSFHSENDAVLDLLGETFGTAEGVRSASAAVTGFAHAYRVREGTAYLGLRQHAWSPAMGTDGSHYSWTHSVFLHRAVAPAFVGQ